MQIPKRLAYVLERDQPLDGAVTLSISQFEPWIKNAYLPFFPEYTKHDIEHIEGVLRTAAGLIRDDSWASITAPDAAVLILAILLHDCAMHLSEDGVFSLLAPDRCDKKVAGMDDKPWNILWEDFYGEASRFDGRKLTRLFGDAQPVRRPPTDPNQLTKRDRLLIGEFLRRHHPRLAHEIALFGVPAKGNNPLTLQGFLPGLEHIPQLAGLVARSHGANIGEWNLFSLGDCSASKFDFKKLVTQAGIHLSDYTIISEICFGSGKKNAPSPMGSKWFEVLKCAEIPFDPKIRRKQLKHAYKELAPYIEAHEAIKNKKAKEPDL